MSEILSQVQINSSAYSIENEQAVLSAILRNPSVFTEVAVVVRPEFFYLPQHRDIFEAMVTIDSVGNSSIDPLLILEILKSKNTFPSEEDGKQYIFTLVEAYSSESNISNYCKILKDKFYIRTLINVSNEIIHDATESDRSADQILDDAEQKIYNIREGKTLTGPSKLSEVITNVYKHLAELNSDQAEQFKGLPTGFPDLDKMITGLNKSDLVLIGARPAMGKTSFTLNMARNCSVSSGKRVLFFSLEMTKEQLAQRLISTEARVSGLKMRTGIFTAEEWQQIHGACTFLSGCEIFLDDTSNMTVPEMKARTRRLKNVSAVFIDYLQLMTSAKKTENRVQEVSDITRNLKLMAKDLMVPVVVCAQLSRSTEGRGQSHKPQLADLRESGSIEQDADIVLMLYRPDYYNSEKDKDKDKQPDDIIVNSAQLLVQKNRHGPTGTVEMIWDPRYTLYTCAAPRNEISEGSSQGGNNNAE